MISVTISHGPTSCTINHESEIYCHELMDILVLAAIGVGYQKENIEDWIAERANQIYYDRTQGQSDLAFPGEGI
jgi:hypothetical protein